MVHHNSNRGVGIIGGGDRKRNREIESLGEIENSRFLR